MPASWEVVPGTLAEFYGNISLACSWNRVPTEGSASRRSSLQFTVRNYRFQNYKFKVYRHKLPISKLPFSKLPIKKINIFKITILKNYHF